MSAPETPENAASDELQSTARAEDVTSRLAVETGSGRIGTFNRSPLGFPPEEPPAVDLVLLVAAHHCERDHLLLAGSEIMPVRGFLPGVAGEQ